MNACRSCNAPVTWVLTEAGKRMPIDAEPCEDGNLEIIGERTDPDEPPTPLVRYLKQGEGATLPGIEAPPRFKSHFATCPQREEWRRR